MLRVISRPITVPAERIALLNAGLPIILSNMPGSADSAGAGIGGSSPSAARTPAAAATVRCRLFVTGGGGASLAARRS